MIIQKKDKKYQNMKKASTVITGILLISLCFYANIAYSQDITSDSVKINKIRFIEESIRKDEQKTRLWWNGWLIGYGAATVGQGAVYFISNDKSLKQDMALGAFTTILGFANQFISSLKLTKDFEQLELLPSNSPDEKDKKLQFAEELLKEHARCEILARNWQSHALCGVVNIGGGLITWLGFKRTIWDGIANFALNTAITEAQIWTSPLRAKKDYENYLKKYGTSDYSLSYKQEIDWYFNVFPGGAGIKIVF